MHVLQIPGAEIIQSGLILDEHWGAGTETFILMTHVTFLQSKFTYMGIVFCSIVIARRARAVVACGGSGGLQHLSSLKKPVGKSNVKINASYTIKAR